MTTSQKELRKYLVYLSDKMTPEEAGKIAYCI